MKLNPAKIKRVLVVAKPFIGDHLFCSAALYNLRQYLPGAYFVLYAVPAVAELCAADTSWQEIHTFDRKTFKGIRAIKTYRAGHYDLVIDFCSNILQLFSGARYKPIWSLLKRQLSRKYNHETARNLYAMSKLGVPVYSNNMRCYVSDELIEETRKELGGAAKNLIILNLGASYETKMWGTENFLALANLLTAHFKDNCKVAVMGYSDIEIQAAQEIIAKADDHIIDFSGKTNILKNAARISLAKLFVTGDTGPLHLASAFSIPTVALFGATTPTYAGCWGSKHENVTLNYPCSPCGGTGNKHCKFGHINCMKKISPQKVFQIIQKMLI